MTSESTPDYDDEIVDYLQLFRGEGFLSPGGADETQRVLDHVDLNGRTVLEVGSGLGGCSLIMVAERGAAKVIGLDVEPVVIERARAATEAAGWSEHVEYRQVEPGPFPIDDASVDAVFSKDAMCHIEDKQALYAEVFRVLKPGGQVAVGDWLSDRDPPYSEVMQTFIDSTGLHFHLDSLDGVHKKLTAAGFENIEVVNRNQWFREEARREAELLEGPLADKVESLRGKSATDSSNECQHHMIAALDSGEFCPAHFFASKPD